MVINCIQPGKLTLGRLWGENTGQFVQHPVGWGIEALQVLLLTASHFRLSSLTESEKKQLLQKLAKKLDVVFSREMVTFFSKKNSHKIIL